MSASGPVRRCDCQRRCTLSRQLHETAGGLPYSAAMAEPDLAQLRDRIEAVDRKIIALVAERLKIVEDVVAAKLSAASPFRDREREDLLLPRLRGLGMAAGLAAHQGGQIGRAHV